MIKVNFIGVELLGLVFGVVMMYLTYLAFRKKDFVFGDFLLWFLVWLGFSLAVIFPWTLKGFMETFGVVSVVQVFSILGMMFIFVVVFYLYKTVRKSQKKLEEV